MQKINLLPSEIYNKISAGEVVENPASIVKELVENSIDAGSNNIVVEIVDGGITSIIVSDNGHGISKDYIKHAFLPHATSKIATDDDLENISTLGFRGEALPSIAAISSVEIKTKAIDENIGVKYQIKGGVGSEVTNIDCNVGTNIEVRNIFFNTPARQKFLKKPKSEEHEITSIIQGLILANPNVAIKYVADGKIIFNSNGKGIENALYAIYPISITKHLVYLESERYDIKVRGYIGLPTLTKPNRNFQTTIVNGRLITNATISTAVSQAYGNMLMKRTFPVFCLEIVMPFNMLDVNVTPSKTDVRFCDNRSVFSSVYHAVQNALSQNHKIFGEENDDIVVPQNNNNLIGKTPNYYENSPNLEEKSKNNSILTRNIEKNSKNDNLEQFSTNDILSAKINQSVKIYDEKKDTNNDIYINNDNINKKQDNTIVENTNNNEDSKTKTNELLEKFGKIKSDTKNATPINNASILKVRDTNGFNFKKDVPIITSDLFEEIEEEFSLTHKIIGQIFNCYLIVAKADYVYLIDQHAAHERMIYDKLIEQIESKNIASQPLLTSQIVQLSPKDSQIVENLLDDIKKIGFDIEAFGDYTFKINSVPIVFPNFNGYKFINSLLEEKNAFKNIDLKDTLHNELAKKACRSAIKAGQKLKDIEIQNLIKDIEENKPIQCPHGRPTIIKFTKKDIDKLFKRIL